MTDASSLRLAATAVLSTCCVCVKAAGLCLLVATNPAPALLLPAASLVLSSWGIVADDAELALSDTVGGETLAEVPDFTEFGAATEGVRDDGACGVQNTQTLVPWCLKRSVGGSAS